VSANDSAAAFTARSPEPALPVSLYVHVPYCLSRCAYCDFTSSVADPLWHASFVDAVLFEAGHWSFYDLLGDVPTLYFGGGTPTVLGPGLARLVRGVRETAVMRPSAEITVETNPDTTTREAVSALVNEGVNRFSLGVQSFDDEVLAVLGRRHDAAAAASAASVLQESGARFSVDLMCGIPGQSMRSWQTTLERAVATGATHASVYPLSVEEGTPLAGRVQAGSLELPDPDAAAEMMLLAEEVLGEAGLLRYETANYARPGEEARHNTVYWAGGAYLGLGPSASGMLPAATLGAMIETEGLDRVTPAGPGLPLPSAADARARFTQVRDVQRYIRDPLRSIAEVEYLTAEEAQREDVMLGMRLTQGVPAEKTSRAGLDAVFDSLAADGLVELAGGRWRTTSRGWLLGNEVFGRIWNGA
jgi:oxygen-independent coproporphyrinogen-3 oxidase